MSPEALSAIRLCWALKRSSFSPYSGEFCSGIVPKPGSLAPDETSFRWRNAPSIAMNVPAIDTWMLSNQDGGPLVGIGTSAA